MSRSKSWATRLCFSLWSLLLEHFYRICVQHASTISHWISTPLPCVQGFVARQYFTGIYVEPVRRQCISSWAMYKTIQRRVVEFQWTKCVAWRCKPTHSQRNFASRKHKPWKRLSNALLRPAGQTPVFDRQLLSDGNHWRDGPELHVK